jgi:phenylalanyl-tRNA synthetase beta subunit
LNPYKEVSNFPPVYKDISFFTWKNKFLKDEEKSKKEKWIELTTESEADLFEISWVIRDISGEAWDLIEEVKLMDIYENDAKFWTDKKSICIRIAFRSLQRTLTDEEINKVYFAIRGKLEELWYILR